VGSFFANEFGVFDLSGNVWEWCQDYHDKNYYQISPSNNPQGPDTGPLRVMRGGSWRDGPTDARVAYRGYGSPHGRYVFIGFRIARKP
jgi:formylglycine-generating enzyme required for sulfatase activity